jgi:hypothetical protein
MGGDKVIRELRLLVVQLPTDRFYAVYLLVAVCIAVYLLRH